jgi:hypothetical protein
MLNYGAKSRCCRAPIRLGFKKSKFSKIKHTTWVCTRCHRSDIDIISDQEANNQGKSKFSETEDFPT